MRYPTSKLENLYLKNGYSCIAGLDEAGKGAWAGPVVSAAVVLPPKARLPQLNDSKLVKSATRERLFDLIVDQAIAWGVGIEEAYLIDEIGLAEAHRRSMRSAVQSLSIMISGSMPDLLLVDGIGIKQLGVETICLIKGDQKVRSISAASILAKVTRDRIMVDIDHDFPQYGFKQHKGYGTREHQRAIVEHGICKFHRLSYLPVYCQWQEKLV